MLEIGVTELSGTPRVFDGRGENLKFATSIAKPQSVPPDF